MALRSGNGPDPRPEEVDVRTNAEELTLEMETGGIVTRGEEWDDLSVRHLDLPPGTDFTPLFKGLPGDRCQSAHWGYVLRGSIHVRYADGTEEVTRAGQLYHWPADHTGWTEEGVVFIELSPVQDVRPVLEHVAAQVEASA